MEISQTKHGVSCCNLDTVGKSSMSRGAKSWFHNVWTYNEKVIEYWTKFSLKISIKSRFKIIGEFGTHLVLLESLIEYNLIEVFFLKNRPKVREILNFE